MHKSIGRKASLIFKMTPNNNLVVILHVALICNEMVVDIMHAYVLKRKYGSDMLVD